MFCEEITKILSSISSNGIIASLVTSRISSIPRIKKLLAKLLSPEYQHLSHYYISEIVRILETYYRDVCLAGDVVILFDPYGDLGYHSIADKIMKLGNCVLAGAADDEHHYSCGDGDIEITYWHHENGWGVRIKGKKYAIMNYLT